MSTCHACGSSDLQADGASGTTFCASCGVIVEENAIVSEITFGEASSGAAVVQGSFVGADQTHARMGGLRKQGSMESREQTIQNGRRRMIALANALRLSERVAESAHRYFILAVNNNFIKGRRSQYVIASCLYIICRNEKTSHMLIDFSDILQINVFVLGSTFLKLLRCLNISLPIVDPSLYIARFAAMLDYGNETQKVAGDATRLVQRMDRDWMHTGRRPAGICGAALLIASRMNNFCRSIREVVHVVKVADVTLQKRLDEFKATPSGNLTIEEFQTVWLEQSNDPPAYIRNKKAEKKKKKIGHLPASDSEDNGETSDTLGVISITDADIDPVLLRGMQGFIQDENAIKMSTNIEASPTYMKKLPISDGADDLSDVDDDEIESVLLNEREISLKTQVWMELNKDYLAEQEAKRLRNEADKKAGIDRQPKKRKRHRPKDSSHPDLPETPAESAKLLIQKKAFSKKINYAALDHLFD
ncbi:Transcription factor IIIB subunit [Neolecta irregularis DAH-3]|uniref:B-related factor 1 n=1 Tax=Neolecta irregularis (strain DAH-3) TaxID=1198029 RepID=A0A1U7LPV0_NEOID|nr:Transcription factor IIIB subunit [Neolecta irregularis DAH-3]|eukprot:OLL24572.1 Transcription factor IIIB subunit [Neolecta irregularis DAH-3]